MSVCRQPRVRALLLAICLIACVLAGAQPSSRAGLGNGFASLIERLSEPDGYFDTDNLISNERSYLHVVGALQQAGVKGGAYLGVGPDQNFSYIAHIRPNIAFIIDIRRDNLLLHLLFKALFDLAPTRVEYLCMLSGRPAPPRPIDWREASVDKIAAYIDSTASTQAVVTAVRARVDEALTRIKVPLSSSDRTTIDRFHRTFISQGLALKFQSAGRAPRDYYPTYRDLLLETDRSGQRRNFLASEDDFQFVRSLEQRDLVIPVVGDLGGTHALRAIGQEMAARGEQVSAFYTSNVEFYLLRSEGFARFIDNATRLPRSPRSVIIRSVFGGVRTLTPSEAIPGSISASIVRPLNELIEGFSSGGYRRAGELVVGARAEPPVR